MTEMLLTIGLILLQSVALLVSLLIVIAFASTLGTMGMSAKNDASDLPEGLTAASPPTPMPVFQLPALDGRTVSSTDLQGKVVVLRFWTTW